MARAGCLIPPYGEGGSLVAGSLPRPDGARGGTPLLRWPPFLGSCPAVGAGGRLPWWLPSPGVGVLAAAWLAAGYLHRTPFFPPLRRLVLPLESEISKNKMWGILSKQTPIQPCFVRQDQLRIKKDQKNE